jgi:hypothetical protein
MLTPGVAAIGMNCGLIVQQTMGDIMPRLAAGDETEIENEDTVRRRE